MKAQEVGRKVFSISVETTIKISATPKETAELRRALAVVDNFKKAAFKAARVSEKYADWTKVGFAVKTDAVLVTIEQGMAG